MADRPVILLTGASGQVGSELHATLAPIGRVVAPRRSELDLTNVDAIRRVMRDVGPRIVVNAAAYTAVERAETETADAMRINGVAPGVLAEEATRLHARMIHYSTDYVFDGSKGSPYDEDDAPAPLNAYGRTKLAGERAVMTAGDRHVVLRTSWVYGGRGSNFVRTMLRLARERREIPVVDDQVGTPTWSRSIATATATLLVRLGEMDDATAGGILHLTSAGSASWYDFARAILSEDTMGEESTGEASASPRVVPISSSDFASAVRRPAYSVLDSSRAHDRFGIAIPDWRSDLRVALTEMTARAIP